VFWISAIVSVKRIRSSTSSSEALASTEAQIRKVAGRLSFPSEFAGHLYLQPLDLDAAFGCLAIQVVAIACSQR
jgi:hypothetical protein